MTVSHDDLYAGANPTLTAEQAAAVGALLDARAPERFRGDVEPVDPVAGHIPGAKNVPSTSVLADDGTFRGHDELTRLFTQRGAVEGDTGVYCGSGVTAVGDARRARDGRHRGGVVSRVVVGVDFRSRAPVAHGPAPD